jgi:hypothetical protein
MFKASAGRIDGYIGAVGAVDCPHANGFHHNYASDEHRQKDEHTRE